MTRARALRGVAVALVGACVLAPVILGGLLTLGAAFGLRPALGFDRPGLFPWHDLFTTPGLGSALRLTLTSGLGSTMLATLLALGVAAAAGPGLARGGAGRMLAPLLAVPHAAMAIGLAFLFAPSGWIARLLAPLAGWDRPPALASVNDTAGIALTLGLTIKEFPFVLLVVIAALGQVPVARHVSAARALGYPPGSAWVRVILPQVWPLIRLPVLVVLAYALSNVDMALILGPSNPPTLAVLVLRMFTDPDLSRGLTASAGAVLQVVVVALAIAALVAVERLAARAGTVWVRRGERGRGAQVVARCVSSLASLALGFGALAMLALLVWSFAFRWPFPALLPLSWTARTWLAADWPGALVNTLLTAAGSVALSLLLAILWLSAAEGRPGLRQSEAVIALPLVLPQIGFLYGLNALALSAGVTSGLIAVIWAHALFVFPYMLIVLGDPWRRVDPRMIRAAAALGAGPLRRLWSARLPILLRPILTAAAVGLAVSVAQYLPTLFLGAGRVPTLTTEAVTLASGSDRRITGVYATLQAFVPCLGFLLAALIPAWVHRNRRGLSGEAAG